MNDERDIEAKNECKRNLKKSQISLFQVQSVYKNDQRYVELSGETFGIRYYEQQVSWKACHGSNIIDCLKIMFCLF